eukprot:1157360-Pelagomonas_calceolata.AAC.8
MSSRAASPLARASSIHESRRPHLPSVLGAAVIRAHEWKHRHRFLQAVAGAAEAEKKEEGPHSGHLPHPFCARALLCCHPYYNLLCNPGCRDTVCQNAVTDSTCNIVVERHVLSFLSDSIFYPVLRVSGRNMTIGV